MAKKTVITRKRFERLFGKDSRLGSKHQDTKRVHNELRAKKLRKMQKASRKINRRK